MGNMYVLIVSTTHSEDEFYSLLKIKQARALPCFSTSFKGSTPGERMKNMGVAGPDSSKETAKSSDLPITYLLPSFSSTKSLRGEYGSVLLNIFLLCLTDKLHGFKSGNLLEHSVLYRQLLIEKNINSSHDCVVSGFFQNLWIESINLYNSKEEWTVTYICSVWKSCWNRIFEVTEYKSSSDRRLAAIKNWISNVWMILAANTDVVDNSNHKLL